MSTSLRTDPLSPDSLQRVLRPIGEACGLPNAAYVDPGHFVHERDQVIGRTWAALAFEDVLPDRPYAYPVDFMGLPLLITRDRGGILRVFHNVCSHRGMKLVAEPCDVRGVINCRYHCWAYAANGDLKATPHIGGVDRPTTAGFDNAAHGLKAVRSAVFMGMIFVNLSGDAPDFKQHIAPLECRAAALLGADGWQELHPGTSHARLVLEVRCNWKLAVENYCESYHLPWVHPALNEYSRLEDHYCFSDAAEFAGQGSLAYRLSEVAGTRLPRLPQWPGERTHLAEYPALYPNVLLAFQADHAFAVILTPVSPACTLEEVRIFYVGDGAHADRYAGCRAATQAAWNGVFREDVFAVEGMQQGRASPGYQGGVFSPVMDEPTHHFNRWVAARLAAAGRAATAG
jgi:choline monooxygenase